jgi:hypothetical protein
VAYKRRESRRIKREQMDLLEHLTKTQIFSAVFLLLAKFSSLAAVGSTMGSFWAPELRGHATGLVIVASACLLTCLILCGISFKQISATKKEKVESLLQDPEAREIAQQVLGK